MTRRGQAEMIDWFPRLLLLLIAVIIIAMLVRYFADREPETADLHRTSYLYRLHYDGHLFTYKDSVGRVYPGVVDLEKLSTERLNGIFGLHAKISSRIIVNSSCGSKEAWHDRDTWEQYIGFARFGTLGPGSATVQDELLPVTVVSGEDRCAGIMNITIVRPNT